MWVKATFLVHCPFRYAFELLLLISWKLAFTLENFQLICDLGWKVPLYSEFDQPQASFSSYKPCRSPNITFFHKKYKKIKIQNSFFFKWDKIFTSNLFAVNLVLIGASFHNILSKFFFTVAQVLHFSKKHILRLWSCPFRYANSYSRKFLSNTYSFCLILTSYHWDYSKFNF